MKIIGLTGGIASGKSTVAQHLEKLRGEDGGDVFKHGSFLSICLTGAE